MWRNETVELLYSTHLKPSDMTSSSTREEIHKQIMKSLFADYSLIDLVYISPCVWLCLASTTRCRWGPRALRSAAACSAGRRASGSGRGCGSSWKTRCSTPSPARRWGGTVSPHQAPHTHTCTHAFTHSLTHARTHTHTHTQARTHTHTYSLSLFHIIPPPQSVDTLCVRVCVHGALWLPSRLLLPHYEGAPAAAQ